MVMTRAGIRDLKNNLSRYLRRLKPGAAIAITDRGRVIAELRAPGHGAAGHDRLTGNYARLLAEGVIRPRSQSGDPLASLARVRARAVRKGTAAALVREDRDRDG